MASRGISSGVIDKQSQHFLHNCCMFRVDRGELYSKKER